MLNRMAIWMLNLRKNNRTLESYGCTTRDIVPFFQFTRSGNSMNKIISSIYSREPLFNDLQETGF